jgi:predicted DsbA family dithiol-disulfide isomerase
LVQLGKSKGAAAQTRVVEALMEAYFEEEQDITSTEALKAAGVKAGLDQNEVAEWLAGDAGGREIDMEVQAAKMAGISGVPNFTVNGRYEIGGAQDSDVFLGLFEKIKAAETL